MKIKTINDLLSPIIIPLKNIWRNRRRTILTMAGICVSSISLLIFVGYILIMDVGLRNHAISNEYGHFQIARTGYFDTEDTSVKHMMPEQDFSLLEDFLYNLDEVDIINMRLHITGLVGNQNYSTYFLGICGQPENEIFMLPSIIKGEPISEVDPSGVIIGNNTAKKLDVEEKADLILFLTTSYGAPEAIRVNVRGIFKGFLPEQESILYIPLETAWELMLEKKVHRILVFLKDSQDLPVVMQKTREFIQDYNLDLEVRSWDELAIFYQQIISMFSAIIITAGIIISIVIIFNISNTMHMAIIERTREIGTLRAIGISRTRIIIMFLTEGFFIGLIGSFLGILLGCILIPVINSLNIMLPPGPGSEDPIPFQILMDGVLAIFVIGLHVLIATLGSLMPSFRSNKLKIINALRQV